MDAHLHLLLAVQQLCVSAQQQQAAHLEAELLKQRQAEEAEASSKDDSTCDGMFAKFDTSKDGFITAEEFRACIDSTLHSTAEGHIFTLSHARLLIRLVDTDGNRQLDKGEFRYLWKHISAWSNFFLSRAHVDPAHGPIWPLTAFSAYLRLQLQAFRMPGDGTDAQLRDKIDNVVDLVCESLSSSHGYLIISDFYSVQASLALVGKFSGSLGAVPTLLDMLRFSYYVRG